MLSETAREAIGRMTMVLRIIVVALAMGVLAFAAYVAVQNAGKPQNVGTNVHYLGLALSVPMLLAAFIVPRLTPKTMPVLPTGQQPADPEVAEAMGIFAAIQTSTIIGCAILEGTAFLNLVLYMINVELVHAAIAAFCVILILAQFPVNSRIEQRIEDQLRRQREERYLAK